MVLFFFFEDSTSLVALRFPASSLVTGIPGYVFLTRLYMYSIDEPDLMINTV